MRTSACWDRSRGFADMTALHSVQATHLRSALPTVNHTRTVLQKQQVAERPMPPAAVVTISPQATRNEPIGPQAPPLEPPEPARREDWDTPETWDSVAAGDTPPPERGESAEPQGTQGQASLDGLTADQRQMVIDLVRRDREVRTHEAAHQAAGGGLVGAASYSYQQGPDGRSYAIGGECSIQIPASDKPSEMISIAQRVRAAALAPANPSGQDLAVANAAVQMEAQARQALAQQTAQQQQAQAAAPAGQAQGEGADRAGEGERNEASDFQRGVASRAIAAYARSSDEAFAF